MEDRSIELLKEHLVEIIDKLDIDIIDKVELVINLTTFLNEYEESIKILRRRR